MTLTPELQRDIVEGMRSALPKICGPCAWKWLIAGNMHYSPHSVDDIRPCDATAERALLARVLEEETNGRA